MIALISFEDKILSKKLGAVYGTMATLRRLLSEAMPDYVVTFDDDRAWVNKVSGDRYAGYFQIKHNYPHSLKYGTFEMRKISDNRSMVFY